MVVNYSSFQLLQLDGSEIHNVPKWLKSLLEEKFFDPCLRHRSSAKKNVFCIDYRCGICLHCLPLHAKPSHRVLQIRRYVYHDVIRLSDVQKLLDCSLVQPYTTNSAKVVFLNQRPMSRPFRCSGSLCSTCDRSLQHNYLFCSLYCKVQHSRKASKMLTAKKPIGLHDITRLRTVVPRFTYGLSPRPTPTVSNDVGFTVDANFLDRVSASAPTSNHSRCQPPPDVTAYMNRRRKKGVPHRSPLY